MATTKTIIAEIGSSRAPIPAVSGRNVPSCPNVSQSNDHGTIERPGSPAEAFHHCQTQSVPKIQLAPARTVEIGPLHDSFFR